MNVLLADDDPIFARALATLLERAGYAVTRAVDAEHAWDRFAEQRPRIVVADWEMPPGDGVSLCRRIRAADAVSGEYTYVILVTARTDQDDRLAALEAGVDEFLAKPVDRAEFTARMRVAERVVTYQEQLREANARLREHDAMQLRQAAMVDAAIAHTAVLMQALREQQGEITRGGGRPTPIARAS